MRAKIWLSSSLPFWEGHSLRPDIETGTGSLMVDDITAEGSSFRRTWQIAAYEGTSAKPLRQWLVPHSAADSASLGQSESDRLPKIGAVR